MQSLYVAMALVLVLASLLIHSVCLAPATCDGYLYGCFGHHFCFS